MKDFWDGPSFLFKSLKIFCTCCIIAINNANESKLILICLAEWNQKIYKLDFLFHGFCSFRIFKKILNEMLFKKKSPAFIWNFDANHFMIMQWEPIWPFRVWFFFSARKFHPSQQTEPSRTISINWCFILHQIIKKRPSTTATLIF